MKKTGAYKMVQVTYYDDFMLNVIKSYSGYTKEKIEEIAIGNFAAVLMSDGLHVISGDEQFVVSDEEKEKYFFEICTKELPPPVDARVLSTEAQKALIHDERYMTTPDDYQKMDWSLSDVYKKLKMNHPDKHHFSFSSAAYGIEEL